MNAAGRVLTPLNPAAVNALVPRLVEERIESVAVGFLHGYANPAHEHLVRDVLGAVLPDVSITLASDVCPEIREFERFSTACANAYVKPLMSRYLTDLKDRLNAFGVRCPFLMMTSGGGLCSVDTAREFPIRLVESGPAGGAILAARMAEELELPRVVSLDMGGTTAKICLIDDGEPQLSRSFEVDRSYRFKKGSGLPVRIPVVEMVEIGAGGGSLASVDRLDRIQVGPQSAGSEPGPACYGRGGTHATVTDADVVLERLDPARFAGGTLHLDVDAARAVVEADVARPWASGDGGVCEAADAIIEVVDENMAAAARAHASEWGKEIASRTLIAFGGAAPIHAANIADKLELDAVLVPPAAGVGSAVGFLAAPVSYEVVRSRYLRLSAFDRSVMDEVMADMRAEAEAVVGPVAQGELSEIRRAYMRYVGQGFEIAVPVEDGTVEGLRSAFDAAYEPTLRSGDTWTGCGSAELDADAACRERGRQDPWFLVVCHRRRIHRRGRQRHPHRTSGSPRRRPGRWTDHNRRRPDDHGGSRRVRGARRRVRQCHTPAVAMSKIRDQLVWNRLLAIVEEQAQTLMRTAFSAVVREAGDLSAGVFDTTGAMLAQAVTGTPGHVNAMAGSVGKFLTSFPLVELAPGDVLLTNDPWDGTGHLTTSPW